MKLARLRFIGILLLIGVVITQWDTLTSYYERWTRPADTKVAKSDTEYFCPMHPSVVRDNPKEKCPICFMPLSKRKKGEVTNEVLPAGVVNRVQLSPYRVVLAGVHTTKVEYLPLHKEISTVGYIEFNERGQKTVSARVNGRVEKLLVNETGQMVAAGDVLASLYSPDLSVTMQSLLDSQKNKDQNYLDNAKQRLKLLGIDDEQISEALRSGKIESYIKIRSLSSGHVIKKYVREGQYVQEGMPLYDVADLSSVWIQAQIYEDDLALLPVEQSSPSNPEQSSISITAMTRSFPNEEFKGKLTFIYPHIDQDTRTVIVRFEIDNPGHKLRPGGTANVKIHVQPQSLGMFTSIKGDATFQKMLSEGKMLAVPDSSIIATGSQTIIYRETLPGTFEGVEVKLGPKMTDTNEVVFYPVLNGLSEGDKIVTSGSFLVDAETRLNPAAGSIYFGGSGGKNATSTVTTVRPTTPEDGDAKIKATLTQLTPDDRRLAEEQRFCPILSSSRLGSMGKPIKILIEGQSVFICCPACEKSAKANPSETLAKVAALKKNASVVTPTAEPKLSPTEEAEIKTELSKLPEAERKQVEAQRFCAVVPKNRLGSMGAPIKLQLGNETVYLCCEGCVDDAKADPSKTLEIVRKLHAQFQKKDGSHD